MKIETIVGIAILLSFCAFLAFGGEVARYAVFLYGCFAVGWTIPTVARTITGFFSKKESAQ